MLTTHMTAGGTTRRRIRIKTPDNEIFYGNISIHIHTTIHEIVSVINLQSGSITKLIYTNTNYMP